MTILVNIIIGVIMGIAIVGVANLLKKPQDNKAKQIFSLYLYTKMN